MASLTANHSANATDETTGAAPSPWSRLAALAATIFGHKASGIRASAGHIDGDLSGLNDETLLDLGLDPASVRHPIGHADPRARFYL